MNGIRDRDPKADAPRESRLARMQPEIENYSVSPVELHRLHTVYFDTADARLARYGCSLWFCHGDGWTFKIPVPRELNGGGFDEHHFAGDGSAIPAAVLELGTAYFRGEVPARVAELRTVRTSRHVIAALGNEVASLIEDDVHVIDGARVVDRFRRTAVEPWDGAPAALLDDLTRLLCRSDPARAVAPESTSASEWEAPALDEESRVGEVVRAALAGCVDLIVRLDARLRTQPSEDVVHRTRVAVRRMRSHLRSFLPVLDARRAGELRDRLGWLQDGLSEARDADVFIAGMLHMGEVLCDADREALDRVLQPFVEARAGAYALVGAMLRDERYVSLLRDIVEAVRRPPLISANERLRDAAPAIISAAWSTLRKRVRRCAEPPTDRELHGVRIAAKRVRYLAEALAPVLGPIAIRLAEAVERLQTVLGEQHDAVMVRERLRALAHDPQRAFIAGELAGTANAAARQAGETWTEAWGAAKRCRRALRASLRP